VKASRPMAEKIQPMGLPRNRQELWIGAPG
jgi:hypothetical protein